MSQQHISALDGIRGLAILFVMAFHLTTWSAAPAPTLWLALVQPAVSGVDLFFVLSGFLITGILWDSRGIEHAWRRFYVRRALRIFPLYYAFLALAFAAAVWFRLPELPAMKRAAPWLLSYGHNLLAAWRLDWLGLGPSVAVTWSLCIEEQFYLLWPFAVLRLRRQRLMALCVAFMAVALAFRVLAFARTGSYFPTKLLLVSRMDALAAGAWLALRARGPQGLSGLRPAAVLVLAFSAAFWLSLAGLYLFSGAGPFIALHETVGYSIWAVGYGGGLVLAVTAPRGAALDRVLSGQALGFFGRYSYALYLLHQPARALAIPIFALAGLRDLPPLAAHAAFDLLAGAIAVAFSLASWHLIEAPFLRLKDRVAYGRPARAPVVAP